MISCRQAARFISEGRDHPLPLCRRLIVRLHILICSVCRGYEAQLRRLDEIMRLFGSGERAEPGEAGDRLDPRARERILTALGGREA
jgi:hypothetical protein